jgi:hypothetical protein
MDKVEGTWVGRLIDIGGFEGQVHLTLKESKAAVEGVFEAAIDGQHRPTQLRGKVAGKRTASKVVLKLDLGQADAGAVTVSLEGEVFATRSGERAVCGRYAVSARRSTPLVAGVISLRQPSARLHPDEGLTTRTVVATVAGGAQPDAPPTPKTKPSGGKKAADSNRKRRKG